jgi:transcriptional regulator with XRE-family HTH domain
MKLTTTEKVRLILKRKNITAYSLADKLNQSRQNLSLKFSRDNFSERELRDIAKALDCQLEINFILKNGDKI